MRNIFISFLFFSCALTLTAQQADFFSLPSSYSKKINAWSLSTEFYFASDAITNELAKTYYLDGFITDEMKNEVSKNLHDKNRMGGDFSNEFYFYHHPDSLLGCRNMNWFIGFKNINHQDASFTRDLFEIYFRGNKNYAGRQAVFDGFHYQLLKYQQLQVGIAKSVRKDSAKFEFGGGIGFNNGQQLFRIDAPHSGLYTADDGEFLDVTAAAEIHNSDSLHKNFGAFNGFGVSTDLFFRGEIKKKHFFFAQISNLGFIRWNNHSTELKTDSSFRFEGIDVSQVLNFTDTVRSMVAFDSTVAQPFLSRRKYHSITTMLPAKIEAGYKRIIGESHCTAGLGGNYIFNADYFPLVYLDGGYYWKNNDLELTFSYGGYTTFGAGINYRKYFRQGYTVSAGSNYLNSLFRFQTATSEEIHFTLSRIF
ncbi:MAG: DUF5723 family protein [Bacteroidetes bacterium]|nr:DUF5723 family protein [Bacteroidota bacterium]